MRAPEETAGADADMGSMFLCGTRTYGRVRGYAGQYAATEFGHLCFLPILGTAGRIAARDATTLPAF